MLAAFMLLVPMVSTAQIDIKGGDEETSDLSGTWGTTQITDYQTEEYVPLGEGLWLLAGAAGLYLLVKSRKTRKATAVAAAALALTLGTTQCKKTEESVIPAGETISISFMAGNGAKADIDVYTGRITWNAGDKVYVVCNNAAPSKDNNAVLLGGNLTAKTGSSQQSEISGEVTVPEGYNLPANPSFTFYYVGSDVTFDKTNFTFGIQNQNGIDAGHYMVGRTEPVEMKVKEGTENSYVPTQDGAKHFDPLTSVLRLDTKAFGAGQMTMGGGNNLMTINLAGDATPSYTSGSITFTSGEDVRISVIPTTTPGENENVTLSFSGNGMDGSITVTNGIKAGRIYSKVINNAGYPIHVDANGSGVLSGKFSVSPTEYVQFSRGNLKATRSSSSSDDWKLGFFENQYDYGTYSTGSVFTANDTEMSLFTFGFDSKATSFNPIGQATGSEDWGNEYNRQYSLPSGTWQTLTGGNNGEWWYLLEGRPNAANLRVFKTVHGHSNCLIILPDGFDLSVPEDDPLTNEQWSDLEAKGAVCLPQAGIRNTLTYGTSSNGYWANNSYGASNAYGVFFSGSTVATQGGGCSNYGYSVRLVQKFDWPEVEVTFVDLGLPSGTLWADVNVGAVSKTGVGSYGKYYAWGETAAYLEPMTGYGSWAGATNANYVEGVIKQHANNNYWKWQFPYGSTAKYKSKDLMLPEDDIATQKYGDGCHIPTMDQWYELFNDEYCTWTWDASKNGYIVTSVKYPGRSIFIPQAGYYKEGGSFTYDGTMARFWSSDYWNSIAQNCVYINPNGGIRSGSGLSDYGNALTIRAVKPKPVPAGFVD